MEEPPTTIASLQEIDFLGQRLEMLRESILDHGKHATFWIGAGFSSKYGGNPTWHSFLWEFQKEHCPPAHADSALIIALLKAGKLDLAVEMLVRLSEREFYKAIESVFAKSFSSYPDFLRTWNVHDVITTNYDTLAEQCFNAHEVLLPSSGMRALLSAKPKVVKIHGSANKSETCVASIANYVRNYDNNLQWYLTNIFQTRTIIFFGSSMNPSEPYFEILRRLRTNDRMKHKHFCVLAVKNRIEAKVQGKRLEEYGIETIPYFPDREHSFVDELLIHVDKVVRSRARFEEHLGYIRRLIEREQLSTAAVLIRYACERDKISDASRLHLVDSLFELNRAIMSRNLPLDDGELTSLLLDLQGAVSEVCKIFVRTPRTLKGLHRVISTLSNASNKFGSFNIDELWTTYAGQKRRWGLEKPYKNYKDGVPDPPAAWHKP